MNFEETHYPIGWQRSVVRNFCEVPLDKPSPYTSIEIQRAENNGNTGFIALLNHGNRELDILFEEQLALDKQWALTDPATSHLKVRNLKSVEFSAVHCFVSASEVDVQANFQDLQGREIKFRVTHRFANIARPMFTPAPPQKEPASLRFLIMDVFHLLPANATISVSLSGAELPTSSFVLPKGISPFSSTRIGGSLLLSSLVVPEALSNHGAASSDVHHNLITDQDLWMEITGLPKAEELAALQSDERLTGSFVVTSPLGKLAGGQFECAKTGSNLEFRLDGVTQDWIPGWRSPARSMMRHVRNHNRRSERWAFNASKDTDADDSLCFKGAWSNE